MPKNLSWPTAAVLCVAIVCLALTIVLGPYLGLDAETLRFVLGAEGVIGASIAALMRSLLNGK